MASPTTTLEWATTATYPAGASAWSGGATKVAPSAGYIAQGHIPCEPAPAEYENWFKALTAEWVAWLHTEVDTHETRITSLEANFVRTAKTYYVTAVPIGADVPWSGGSTVFWERPDNLGGGFTGAYDHIPFVWWRQGATAVTAGPAAHLTFPLNAALLPFNGAVLTSAGINVKGGAGHTQVPQQQPVVRLIQVDYRPLFGGSFDEHVSAAGNVTGTTQMAAGSTGTYETMAALTATINGATGVTIDCTSCAYFLDVTGEYGTGATAGLKIGIPYVTIRGATHGIIQGSG